MRFHGRTTGVQAEKFRDGEVKNIQLNVGIDKVEGQGSQLEIHYTYGVIYQENIGQILVKGFFLIETEEELVRQTLDLWKREEKMNETVAQHTLRTISLKCTVDAVLASKMVDLPPPIMMPELSISDRAPSGRKPGEKKLH